MRVDGSLVELGRCGGLHIEGKPGRGFSATDLSEASFSVLEPVAGLADAVPFLPRLPAGRAMGRGNLGIQVEAVAVLEPHTALVNHLNARTAAHQNASDEAESDKPPRSFERS